MGERRVRADSVVLAFRNCWDMENSLD